ncbi:MAG: hypothetical protein AVDCRST_MAG39-1149 [uncultured Sphingomonadaceae bacterium]|uniref:Uncharacterized protein n=1 Tax=uncultured Sphingomonadaceae bacterium TaxID=169976 RepID=A0A6J4SDC3_9SPHN|nr:MAG: hypothetical protein AVDCRST_MAG39-1149 [uncultured Sphingomonadaceae bacterium]
MIADRPRREPDRLGISRRYDEADRPGRDSRSMTGRDVRDERLLALLR